LQRLLCVIGSFRLTRNGLLRQTANRTTNIPPATTRENLGFLTLDPRFASALYFSGYIILRVPSRNSNRWKAVKREVSDNGSPAIIRMRLSAELPATEARLRDYLPAEEGHTDAG
jgi:hypothetical protein